MEKGVATSVTLHAVAVLGVLFALAAPAPFETRPQSAITVELVTPKEVPAAEKPPEPQATDTASEQAAPQPQASPAGAQGSRSASEVQRQSEAAAQPAEAAQPSGGGFLDPQALLSMYNMRVPGSGFDAPAEQAATLAGDDVARFRQHLRKCWRLPAGVSSASSTQVVMRVVLTESGALLAEPTLVSASASEDGPLVMRTAIQALEACQPYGFLPSKRYKEWRLLDIGLSPRLMAGG